MKFLISFMTDIIKSRYLIWQLTKRGFSQKYKRSKLGFLWSIIEPLLFMLVLYVVFGIGLRGGSNMNIPYICYLITGLASINFFTETFIKGTVAVYGYSYLLKKVTFRMSILPVVVVLVGLLEHLIFLIIVSVVLFLNHVYINIYWIQIFYYMLSLSFFLLGLTWFTSSVGVFFPDLQQIVSVINKMIFYFSPVFWTIDVLPISLQKYLMFNPLYYIISGYRDSFFYKIPIGSNMSQLIYFWGCTFTSLIIGAFFFKKLRPQFSDYI